jgi:type IV pilus assembly protein PilE
MFKQKATNGIVSGHGANGAKARREHGMTLIELMIVVGLIAILIALAIPSYQQYVRKAYRGDAQNLLIRWANVQEIWRANNAGHAPLPDADAGTLGISQPVLDRYTFSISDVTSSTYTLTATATGDQAKDKEAGTMCTTLTLNQSNVTTPASCWRR